MEGNYYLCIDSAIIIWDKRTTTMIKTNRLPIDRFMIITMPDAECLGVDIQCVMPPPCAFSRSIQNLSAFI